MSLTKLYLKFVRTPLTSRFFVKYSERIVMDLLYRETFIFPYSSTGLSQSGVPYYPIYYQKLLLKDGSLDSHLQKNTHKTTMRQRLTYCLDAARGIKSGNKSASRKTVAQNA